MDEVTVFQPIFRIFLKGCLDALHSKEEDAKHLENLWRTVMLWRKRNKFDRVIRLLRGRTQCTEQKADKQHLSHVVKPIKNVSGEKELSIALSRS